MTTYLSNAIQSVGTSATVELTQIANDMTQQGKDVLGLAAGQSDFETPEYIKTAGAKAIFEGKTRYTPVDGILELREAIANKFKKDNGLDVKPTDCMVSTGGKQIIFNALVTTLNPGDEVVIPAPYWVSYPDIVQLCGAKPVVISAGAETNFKISAEQLDDALSEKTKWLMLNSPSNPTGAIYSADELSQMAEVLRRYPNTLILSDDIYETLIYDQAEFATLAQIAPDLQSRILTMNGVSKAYAMTGWRIGYCTGPTALIGAMKKLQSQSTTNACSIAQWAALAALEKPNPDQPIWLKTFQERRDIIVSGLNEIDGLQSTLPQGAFYAFPKCTDFMNKTTEMGTHITSDKDFVMAMMREAGVGVVHGSAFGVEGYFRLSFATSTDILVQALERIANFCATLK